MPRSSGVYSQPSADFVYDTVIDETVMNSWLDDLGTEITRSLAHDGQTTATANLPMGGFRHTGVGNASARDDYAALGQIQDQAGVYVSTVGGTADAITLTPSPAITAYATGQYFVFKATATSTGSVTIAISGLAATSTVVNGVSAGAGDVVSGRFYGALYDGTNIQLVPLRDPLRDVTGGNVITPHEALIVKRASVTSVDIDADAVLLKDTSGNFYRAESVNLTAAITSSGANGLDTGSEATSTWYHLWVIFDGTTVASLISASASSPTMPSGYTFKGYVGAVYNDSGDDFVWFHQRGSWVNFTRTTALSSGSATTWTSFDLSTACPPTATRVQVEGSVDDNTGVIGIAQISANSSGNGYFEIRSPVQNTPTNGLGMLAFETNQTLYYQVNQASEDLSVRVMGFSFD